MLRGLTLILNSLSQEECLRTNSSKGRKKRLPKRNLKELPFLQNWAFQGAFNPGKLMVNVV